MKPPETTARQVGLLLDMEQNLDEEKYVFSKTRTINGGKEELVRDCLYDLKVSFKSCQTNRVALNTAELYFQPEEYELFLLMLIQHPHPLPSDYRQWLDERADVVCMHLEAIEPPEVFAARLGDTLQYIAQ
ncbi:hypothetical protein [Planococcus lenghuensis]|uniref:Uncharacterized protein n=1 Tax=Planococcus lenghuensis TaxID=2213202 RepID=A0A1Q2L4Y2_9BACL|nr:hypothetical protein [Planococcus lenghuensis]AQQ55424.1 hypothetical protein B0X71_19860 [Planococcus lenghuensis]